MKLISKINRNLSLLSDQEHSERKISRVNGGKDSRQKLFLFDQLSLELASSSDSMKVEVMAYHQV